MNRRIRFVLGAVAFVVIVAFGWFLLLSPIRGDIAATNASIEVERNKLSVAQAKLAQAETTRQEGKKNQGRLLELAKMVPESEEIPSLLLQIQDLADQSGIDFISVTPGAATQTGSFQILPLELEFTGTYFDLSDFVWRAEQMAAGPGRLLAIKTLRLQLGQGATGGAASDVSASPELTVNVTLYAFVMAASPAPATAAGAAQPTSSSGTSPSGTVPATSPSGL